MSYTMSSYLESIERIFRNADSKKVKDKKGFIQNLIDIIDIDKARDEITENTNPENLKEPNRVTWYNIFIKCHQFIKEETKSSTARSAKTLTQLQGACCTILLNVVRYASTPSAVYLDCNTLIASLFEFLDDEAYKNIHDIYIKIFMDYVLSIRLYRVAMKLGHWRKLLKLCITIYDRSYIDKSIVLRTMQKVVQHSYLQSQLLDDIKAMLPFLLNVAEDAASNPLLLSVHAYKLIYTVCEKIGVECRKSLCEFSEKIMPRMIIIDDNTDKYKLFLLFVVLHHPNGAVSSNETAYAHDWSEWKRIMMSLYTNIIKDIETAVVSPSFTRLAGEVFKQLMDDPTYRTEESSSSSGEHSHRIKRRRLSVDIQKPIELFNLDFADSSLHYQWAIVEVLTAMIDKYPHMLNLNDLPPLMELLNKLFNEAIQNEKMTDSLCKLCKILVRTEKSLSNDTMPIKATEKCWDKIWHILVKILGLGQSEKEGHELLQLLINYIGVLSVNAIICLYTTNEIRWSPSSIRTLRIFCQTVTIPDHTEETTTKQEDSVKIRLLRWALNIPSFKAVTCDTLEALCAILTGLTLKTWYEKNQNSSNTMKACHNSASNDSECKSLNDITGCNLSLAFETDLFIKEDSIPTTGFSRKLAKPLFAEETLDFVIKRLCQSISSTNISSENIDMMIFNLTVVAKFASNLLDINVEKNNGQLETLLSTFTTSFTNANELIIRQDLLDRKNGDLVKLIRALTILYENKYHSTIADVIVNLTMRKVLQNVLTLMNVVNDSEPSEVHGLGIKYYEDIFELRDRCREQQRNTISSQYIEISDDSVITIGSHRVITSFCCVDAGKEMSTLQAKVLSKILQVEVYAPTVTGNLWQSLVFMRTIASCRKGFLPGPMMETITTFINELFRQWKNDGNAVKGIVELIPDFFEHVLHVDEDRHNILKTLRNVHDVLSDGPAENKRFGPPVYVNFLKCLYKVIRLLPSLELPPINSRDIAPITEVILCYMKNPSYIVRLEAVRILHFIFVSKEISLGMKKTLFKEIQRIEFNSFVIDRQVREIMKKDEWRTRVATALYVFGSIIHASGLFQTQALNSMLQLHGEKGIKIASVMKILKAVLKNENDRVKLIEVNLYSLITNWIEKSYSQNFPWMLTRATSEEDFYRKYIGVLILIRLENHDLSAITTICENLECSFANVIENNFPSIMTWLLARQSNITDIKSHEYANEIFRRLSQSQDEFKDVKKLSVLLEEKLADVLINLLQKFYDKDHFCQMFTLFTSLPRVNLPNLDYATVEKCLECLETCLPTSNESLIYFLTRKGPNIIQKVLMILSGSIYEFDMIEYKLKAFHQYACFCDLLVQQISNSFFNEMAMFTTRDISYTLLHLIKEDIDPLSELAGKLLLRFLKKILPSRSNEVCEILNFVVTNLISVIQLGKINEIGLKILRFLIVDSTDILKAGISKLDAFPRHSSFDEIRAVHDSLKHTSNKVSSLSNEIEHFLNSGYEKTMTCSLEGLSHLKRVLSEKKEELNKMYQDLEELRGFAEDCSSSILHKLIYRLVKLTENPDISISLEAAQCLGELGAADLTTMILHPEEGQVIESGDPEEILTYQIVVELVEFLVESNVHLREASANALYEVCGSYWGQMVLTKKYLDNRIGLKNPRLLEYTRPFLIGSISKNRHVTLSNENCKKCIDPQNDLWRGDGADSYTNWITNLTCKVLDCFVNLYSMSLVSVCKLSTEFCEMILPKLIYLMIFMNSKLAGNVCKCLNQFFEEYFYSSNKFEQTMSLNASRRDVFSHESVRCMLNIVNFIRIQSGDNFRLNLNYLHIAKAAQHCSAYFTSVLYAELACEIFKKTLNKASDNISTIDHICETHEIEGKSLQLILREAFVQIGDPDSIHGCGLSHLKDPSSRIQHYIHLQQWDKVMISQDAELSTGYTLSGDLANALRHSGLDYLLNRFITTVKDPENIDEYLYETAWRLGDWNILSHRQTFTADEVDLFQSITNDDYYFFHYQALKCLHTNDNIALEEAINNARASIIKSVRNTSLECSQTLYPKLVKLQMLRELEQLATNKPEEWPNVISHWSLQNSLNVNDFSYVEPILSQRIAMCKIKYLSSGNGFMKDTLIDTYLELSKIAEMQGHPHIAARALASLAKQDGLSDEIKDQLQYRDALLAWTRKDQDIARFLLRDLINKGDFNPSLKTRALRVYGNWMAETKSENPQSVIQKYYNKSIQIGTSIMKKSMTDANNLNDTYAALAQFADAQYQQINSFMKTPQFESLQKSADNAGRTVGINTTSKDNDVKRAVITFKKQSSMDVTEYENIQSEHQMYLALAIKYYLITLQTGENHNFFIFRLVSLWLNNVEHNELNKLFMEHLNKIPSFKFIPLVPQLAPHLSHLSGNSFKVQIYELLKRCAKKHPHHTLPILFALMNTQKDCEYTKPSNPRPEPEERELGAKNLISDLDRDGKISPIISEMRRMALALIKLAYLPFESQQARNNIPKTQAILQIRDFQHSIVPTITLEIRPRGDYNNIVSAYKYEESFEGVGGVNAPKKIVCRGTDGVRRKQLVKGKDDLRQDAVMQQVFTVMNLLLGTSKETKRRKLNIRTYKIVPLSQRSGILEWCDNTLPIVCVLAGTKDFVGMHKRHHPEDWAINTCRQKLKNADTQSAAVKAKVYREICEHLQPAFQYFFMEKFPSPETWFERRLAYVRSVATTSMVGYILGLGDRHFSNILIDQATAEVIHIDFGIAFEQGKVLPVPETVPFRLTRDMEAAMGVSGVEGVMRKCCEETMSVLRNRREIIITLLQVLLYDPLFSWTITPARALQLQTDNRGHRNEENHQGNDKLNKIAERALLRIEQKLQGTEDGLATSIAGQVERLIQQARDPANLSRLFCGWQPYL